MIRNTTLTTVDPAQATQQAILASLLQDQEWVAAQFAAIMTASGFGDRVIVGTLSGPPQYRDPRADYEDARHPVNRLPAAGVGSRVRSPPQGRS